MANIKTYLEAILKAVYGEEVRGSIHDAIEAINNNVLDNREEVKGYANDAANSASQAASSASNANAYASQAASSASNANTYATQAASSALNAADSASDANAYATQAQSWAVGGTLSRDGEDTNNAKYYSDQAQRAAAGVSGALSAQGTITFEQLGSVNPNVGWMYNISNDFITDSRFAEGSGVPYKAGTNVYWTANSQWDCLAAGSIDITPENFNGVLPIEKGGTGNADGRANAIMLETADLNSAIVPGVYDLHTNGIGYPPGVTDGIAWIGAENYNRPQQLVMAYPFGKLYSRVANKVYPVSDDDWHEWNEIPLKSDILTSTSQLTNDSGFITSNDIPEGAAASNIVPLPPGDTGSVGTELAFARGDHVHPYGNHIADSSTDRPYKSGIRCAYGGNVDEQFKEGCYPILAGEALSGGGPIFGAVTKMFYKQKIGYAEISDITDSNFSGVLPIEKGGTGNSNGYIPVVVGNEFRPSVGNENGTLYIGFINGWKQYAFHINDTTVADIVCGNINSPSIPSIATLATAGLVKPGTGLEVTSDGTLNVTGGGSSASNIGIINAVAYTLDGSDQPGFTVYGIKLDGTEFSNAYYGASLNTIKCVAGTSESLLTANQNAKCLQLEATAEGFKLYLSGMVFWNYHWTYSDGQEICNALVAGFNAGGGMRVSATGYQIV